MRVISGSRRGRKLLSFEGDNIRPTTDRVKEAMFNLIQGRTADAIVFDAFSGSGALALEAVSRGAAFAVCTDVDGGAVNIIRRNFEGCDFSDKYEAILSSACAYLEKTDKRFDLIFMDPPYNKGLVTPVLEVVARRKLLNADGRIVVERDGTEDSFELSGFTVEKERKYGRTVITVLSLQR